MKKTLKGVGTALGCLLAIAIVVVGANKASGSLADSGKVSTMCTDGQHQKYELSIKDNGFSPAYVEARRCDTLIIKNLDDRARLIAFGKHEQHIPYDGISERYLLKNEEFSVTLDKTGTFLIHDHNQDEVKATFVVR
jgi:hypothetical protein